MPNMDYTEIVRKAREAFNSGKTLTYEFRKQQLENLLRLLNDHETTLCDALKSDLRKSKQEAFLMEVELERNDVRGALYHLKEWMQKEPVKKTLLTMMETTFVHNEPYGVSLIIGAWNYPVGLLLSPLIGAIAAGNCVILKPSEVAPVTAKAFAELIPKYLDPVCFPVVCGGKEETTQLLKERFDFIFYTGSTSVGKIVHAAANKFLTPCILELGGKSPVYIDDSCNMDIAVKRVLWGKMVNSGQTCVAPDYVLCSKDIQKRFVEVAKKLLKEWYGDDVRKSEDIGRMVNDMHFGRVENLLKKSKGQIAIGGKTIPEERYIEPTLVLDVDPQDSLMQDEIFGPVLPFVTINSLDEAINFINSREKPLTMYPFSNKKEVHKEILARTAAGSVCCNDTMIHLGVETLPFGGVGMSGMGAYHGKATFDSFSHKKSVLIRNFSAFGESLASARYPPYSDEKMNKLSFMLKKRKPLKFFVSPYVLTFFLGVITAVAIMLGIIL